MSLSKAKKREGVCYAKANALALFSSDFRLSSRNIGKKGRFFTKLTLEPSPKVLNRIKFGRIGWKEDEYDPRFMGNRKQACFAMERSVVHHNHASFLQGWKKLIGKPKFRQRAVHRTIILQRGQNPSCVHLCLRCLTGEHASDDRLNQIPRYPRGSSAQYDLKLFCFAYITFNKFNTMRFQI